MRLFHHLAYEVSDSSIPSHGILATIAPHLHRPDLSFCLRPPRGSVERDLDRLLPLQFRAAIYPAIKDLRRKQCLQGKPRRHGRRKCGKGALSRTIADVAVTSCLSTGTSTFLHRNRHLASLPPAANDTSDTTRICKPWALLSTSRQSRTLPGYLTRILSSNAATDLHFAFGIICGGQTQLPSSARGL